MATRARRNSRGDKSTELEPPPSNGGNGGGGGAGRTVIWNTEFGASAKGFIGGGGAGRTITSPANRGGEGRESGGGVEIIGGEFCIV